METCVLIPREFSLVFTGDQNCKGLLKNESSAMVAELRISVWSNVFIPAGTLIYPFQGSIRFDKIDLYSLLDDNDVSGFLGSMRLGGCCCNFTWDGFQIRREYGCYDELSFTNYNHNKRQCNWIRFLRIVQSYNNHVNLIGTKVKGACEVGL